MEQEERLIGSLSFNSKKQTELLSETMIIARFEEFSRDSKIPNVVSSREDILFGYQSLPPRDKIQLLEIFEKEISKYGITLKTGYECSKCGFENEVDLDIMLQFFRMVRFH